VKERTGRNISKCFSNRPKATMPGEGGQGGRIIYLSLDDPWQRRAAVKRYKWKQSPRCGTQSRRSTADVAGWGSSGAKPRVYDVTGDWRTSDGGTSGAECRARRGTTIRRVTSNKQREASNE